MKMEAILKLQQLILHVLSCFLLFRHHGLRKRFIILERGPIQLKGIRMHPWSGAAGCTSRYSLSPLSVFKCCRLLTKVLYKWGVRFYCGFQTVATSDWGVTQHPVLLSASSVSYPGESYQFPDLVIGTSPRCLTSIIRVPQTCGNPVFFKPGSVAHVCNPSIRQAWARE